MPLYEVEYVIHLSSSQRDELAQSITQIHSQLFTTPSLFVNVRFTDISGQDVYVGGKKKPANRILAHVRPGGGRSTSDFNELCKRITSEWDRVVNGGQEPKEEKGELRAIFVLGTIIAGSEAGFVLPPAGEDKNWLKENSASFKQKANRGDEEFQDLLEEMSRRDDLRALL